MSKSKVTEAVEQLPALNQQDAHNLLILLNRVSTTGVNEAQLLAVLASKLTVIKGDFNGENANPAS